MEAPHLSQFPGAPGPHLSPGGEEEESSHSTTPHTQRETPGKGGLKQGLLGKQTGDSPALPAPKGTGVLQVRAPGASHPAVRGKKGPKLRGAFGLPEARCFIVALGTLRARCHSEADQGTHQTGLEPIRRPLPAPLRPEAGGVRAEGARLLLLRSVGAEGWDHVD